MPSYRTSISITSPVEPIWRTLSDVVAWAEWLPTVTSVQALDAPALKIGSRYTVLQPKVRPATWTITDLKPPHRFVWQSRSPGMIMIADHVIREQSATQSEVTLAFSFAGLIGAPLGMFVRSLTESYIAQEAAALKLKVEGNNERTV